MPVEIGTGDTLHDTLEDDQTLIDVDDDAALILDQDRRGETVELGEIDDTDGRLRIFEEGVDIDESLAYTDMTFVNFRKARLAYGLWQQCGPFDQPEEGLRAVPIEIATEGQAAIAAYLRVGNGRPRSRQYVSHEMDVSKQTVSNYCNRVAWRPEE